MASVNTEETPLCITAQESILLQIIREICAADSSTSGSVKAKVSKILAECDLAPYLSLHRFNTVDESASTALGIVLNTGTELTFNEQCELNQAIIQALQSKLPALMAEVKAVCGNRLSRGAPKGSLVEQQVAREERIRELMEGADNKLNILKEQEGEKVKLMMEWLNFKLQDAGTYSCNATDLDAVKTQILELKSKILHLQILHGIFTETNYSVQAYSELHRDIRESIQEVESRIKQYQHIIHND